MTNSDHYVNIFLVKEREIIKAANEKELMMVDIWKKILQVSEISVTDHFLELGGDSIKAIQIQIELAKRGCQISVKDMMQYGTLKELCEHMTEREEEEDEYTADPAWISQEAKILGIDADAIENGCGLTVMQEGILMLDMVEIERANVICIMKG